MRHKERTGGDGRVGCVMCIPMKGKMKGKKNPFKPMKKKDSLEIQQPARDSVPWYNATHELCGSCTVTRSTRRFRREEQYGEVFADFVEEIIRYRFCSVQSTPPKKNPTAYPCRRRLYTPSIPYRCHDVSPRCCIVVEDCVIHRVF